MAKFLTTVGTSFYVEEIIRKAEKNLTLITPYLKLSQNLIERLVDADKTDIKITLIYGKSQLGSIEKKQLYALKNIQIYFCENLHAKCYFNESLMIITSMNLYEFSERNNREMGILVEKDKDMEIYKDAIKESESIINKSTTEKRIKDSIKEEEIKIVQETKIILKPDQEIKFKIHSKFKEVHNFFLPELYRILVEKYPEKVIGLDNFITINKFPWTGMTLEVNGRIDLKFSDKLNYEKIKRINAYIDRKLPGIRFYWNYYQLNIYTEKDFNVGMDLYGLKAIINKYLQIIDVLYTDIKI